MAVIPNQMVNLYKIKPQTESGIKKQWYFNQMEMFRNKGLACYLLSNRNALPDFPLPDFEGTNQKQKTINFTADKEKKKLHFNNTNTTIY